MTVHWLVVVLYRWRSVGTPHKLAWFWLQVLENCTEERVNIDGAPCCYVKFKLCFSHKKCPCTTSSEMLTMPAAKTCAWIINDEFMIIECKSEHEEMKVVVVVVDV